MVARFAHFFGVQIPVPGSDFEPTFFLIDHFLDIGCFAPRVRYRWRRQIGQKLVYSRNITGGLIFDLVAGVIFITEELGAFGPQLRSANNNVARIERAAFTVAGERRLHNAFAHRPVLQRSERRLAGGILQPDNKLTFFTVGFGSSGCGRDFVIG